MGNAHPRLFMMTSSFDIQLENCLPDLWRYAWSLTRDRDAADDLVQDCIERALRKRLLWFPGRPLKPWLTKILLNIYRDQWRRETRYRSVDLDQVGDLAAVTGSPEERLEIKAIWKSLETVPQAQKEALLAVVVGGLSYEEAAAALGIPRGTLMSRISRARAKIKIEMDTSPKTKIRSVK
ncbi:RNA polymerase sigma factor [Phaeobacter sp. QD34_3]|uniref:RNA polymerase sigma factor n=1 Tax=unclassified Phaeobacter TaxID=2621772 RepID=UPI00237F418F|nr:MULTISPECIES: RNA polymerase sigma factor [unclassified Phaeobacter]MDE4132558.1 RNA polymerase sigma factor [Phaeobacter sp. QD34_3]MDE4136195.1 RNA polymerase sigma factor [Phaeobacter sp. QD34_24]MDE4174443.1 RNA polymerase sigma factor [Phaeobacter sp. PT47_59]